MSEKPPSPKRRGETGLKLSPLSASGRGWRGFALFLLIATFSGLRLLLADVPKRLDPAAWGSDHVGQPVPMFITGDECLFCHRDKIGTTWAANRHQRTIRSVDLDSPAMTALKESAAKDLVGEIQLEMGDERYRRFLKPSSEYGKLELLSVAWSPPDRKLQATKNPHWDRKTFADSCAGCHTTAVDPKEKTFATVALDCAVCHGEVPLGHTEKPELAHLSPRRKEEPRVVISICAQCHVRTGNSKSTGRPYPTNFVAGDNLFRDFQVDWSDEALKELSTIDRHVVQNVRDVVLFGRESVTCLSCHDIHARSSKKHHRVARSDYCLHCHHADGPKRNLKPITSHSKTCDY